jgi:DNA-binding response OmpR family regulator
MTGMMLAARGWGGDAAGSGRGARRCVLVAEDHADTRLMLRLLLERRGFDVLEAADGEEAVRLVESARPDLILLDAGLPVLDGLAVTRRVRARDTAARVPIVFLSGRAEPLARTAAFDAGCDDYLVKPDGLEDLSAVLTRHLGGNA